MKEGFIPSVAGSASYRWHLPLAQIQGVETLPGIGEIMTFDEDMFFFEPPQRVAHRAGWQQGLPDQVFLGQLPPGFEDFVHEFCRWRQVPDLCSSGIFSVSGYDKNDH